MAKNQTSFKPGQSGNPKGRPPKGRALTELLEKAASKTFDTSSGKRMAGKRLLPELVMQALMTGEVKLPNGETMQFSPKDWADFAKWFYQHIDGPPAKNVSLSGNPDEPILVKVIWEDVE